MVILLYLYLFYLGFIFYAGCQTAINNKQWAVLIPAAPILIPFGLMDILWNQTMGRLQFLEFTYTLTLSQRFDYHLKDTGWRGTQARFFGKILDAILPGHIS